MSKQQAKKLFSKLENILSRLENILSCRENVFSWFENKYVTCRKAFCSVCQNIILLPFRNNIFCAVINKNRRLSTFSAECSGRKGFFSHFCRIFAKELFT